MVDEFPHLPADDRSQVRAHLSSPLSFEVRLSLRIYVTNRLCGVFWWSEGMSGEKDEVLGDFDESWSESLLSAKRWRDYPRTNAFLSSICAMSSNIALKLLQPSVFKFRDSTGEKLRHRAVQNSSQESIVQSTDLLASFHRPTPEKGRALYGNVATGTRAYWEVNGGARGRVTKKALQASETVRSLLSFLLPRMVFLSQELI